MRDYSPKVFEQLLLLVRDEDQSAREWLDREGYEELPHFWDAMENVERSFKWLMENRFPELAATVDAMNGNDKAKVWLLEIECEFTDDTRLASHGQLGQADDRAVVIARESGDRVHHLFGRQHARVEACVGC